jgi:predicted metal-dependent hydrolase
MIKPHSIIRSKRRSFGLEISEDGKLTLRVPNRATKAEIEEVLLNKKQWIARKIALANSKKRIEYKFDESDKYFFLGKQYPILLAKQIPAVNFDGEKFTIAISQSNNIQQAMTNWYKAKAKKLAIHLIEKYTDKLGIEHKQVKISSAKTRWGSCSSRKNININWRLVLAPLQVMEYVVAHEVAHLKYMDHSNSFWDTVEKLQPEYRMYKDWLKQNGHLITF